MVGLLHHQPDLLLVDLPAAFHDRTLGPKGYFLVVQWIGLRENLQESPIFNGKIYGFL